MPTEAPTPTTTLTPASQPPSEVKLTLSNLNAWDEAIDEGRKAQNLVPDNAPDDENKDGEEKVETEEAASEPEGDGKEATETEEGAEAKDKPAGRDYSKFDEVDKPFLKQMSKPAFEHFEKRIAEFKAEVAERDSRLAEVADGKTLPDAWYNDPAAGEASPEFKTASTEFRKAAAETTRLGDILDGYNSGTTKYNAATNTFVPNDDQTPTDPRIVRQLNDARMQAYEQQKEFAAKGNAVLANFSKVYKDAEAAVMTGNKKFFPWSEDPKSENLKYSKQLMSEFPKVFREHPVTKFAANLAVELITLKNAYAALVAKNQTKAAVKGDQRRSGPIPGRNGKAVGADSEKKMVLTDFPGH